MSVHTPTFRTESLTVAAFLMASRELELIQTVQVPGSNRSEFLFADPERKGPGLELEVLSGAAKCSAAGFHRALRNLRTICLSNDNRGEYRVHSSNRP